MPRRGLALGEPARCSSIPRLSKHRMFAKHVFRSVRSVVLVTSYIFHRSIWREQFHVDTPTGFTLRASAEVAQPYGFSTVTSSITEKPRRNRTFQMITLLISEKISWNRTSTSYWFHTRRCCATSWFFHCHIFDRRKTSKKPNLPNDHLADKRKDLMEQNFYIL